MIADDDVPQGGGVRVAGVHPYCYLFPWHQEVNSTKTNTPAPSKISTETLTTFENPLPALACGGSVAVAPVAKLVRRGGLCSRPCRLISVHIERAGGRQTKRAADPTSCPQPFVTSSGFSRILEALALPGLSIPPVSATHHNIHRHHHHFRLMGKLSRHHPPLLPLTTLLPLPPETQNANNLRPRPATQPSPSPPPRSLPQSHPLIHPVTASSTHP